MLNVRLELNAPPPDKGAVVLIVLDVGTAAANAMGSSLDRNVRFSCRFRNDRCQPHDVEDGRLHVVGRNGWLCWLHARSAKRCAPSRLVPDVCGLADRVVARCSGRAISDRGIHGRVGSCLVPRYL